ncbi:MAG TPA: class II aldolase/adducin family protein [Baekduia sp.]|jgi:L-fuculose-phosphate aldolase
MTDHETRQQVALASRVLGANGHDDHVWGHVSLRDPAGRGVWMKRSGLGFEEITAADVLLVGWEGEVLEGDGPRHSEWPIHTEILTARPELAAVVHSHPPHGIAIGATQEPLRPLSHAGTLFVPPEVPRFDLTANLIVTAELGGALADSLGTASACFMVNHGIVTAGPTIQEAVVRAILFEKACQQQVLTAQVGSPATWPDDEASLAKRATVWPPAHLEHLWNYLVRRLEAEEAAR